MYGDSSLSHPQCKLIGLRGSLGKSWVAMYLELLCRAGCGMTPSP
jgi:hypothetical protein